MTSKNQRKDLQAKKNIKPLSGDHDAENIEAEEYNRSIEYKRYQVQLYSGPLPPTIIPLKPVHSKERASRHHRCVCAVR